ncbi:electron transfer flavoprotein subunit beta/FixA family protein [Rhizobium etli]|uniref:electron transfer flavoprotein subunit beta/FixA family protein n=1 Tax=Rhizobium etli TaxID=29449 RepID=UPI0003839298|nr:electron transfer flavoprotein subunit beta/FixA family protein [Rhizobium etli]AGS25524.1 electron transport flavoprotein subunit beta protein [Rhizobium etli bv. mimosae str. Mim1]
MDIIVLIKKVPDPNVPEHFVSISDNHENIILHASSQYSINLYDLNAVEAAISLKEAHGGTITVVTADDASADQYLRRVLAMGADSAVRVELDPAVRNDAFQTADALACAIKAKGIPSLIIAGRQASDTDAGYVPFLIAHGLGIPAISPVVAFKSATDKTINVGKLSEASIDEYELALPAMVLVSNEINKPRTPGLKGVMAAKKATIDVVERASGQVESKPTYAPRKGQRLVQSTQFIEGSDDDKAAALVAALQN